MVFKKFFQIKVEFVKLKRERRVTMSDNEWYIEWQQVTTSGTTSDNEWQRVVQQMTPSDNK